MVDHQPSKEDGREESLLKRVGRLLAMVLGIALYMTIIYFVFERPPPPGTPPGLAQ